MSMYTPYEKVSGKIIDYLISKGIIDIDMINERQLNYIFDAMSRIIKQEMNNHDDKICIN